MSEYPPNFLRERLTINVSTSRSDLSRCLRVLEQFDCKKRIFHRTSSPVQITADDIDYLWTKNKNHIERHFDLANLLDTPYVYELADDDIYFTEFAFSAVKFLDENEEYVSVRGFLPSFNESSKRIDLGTRNSRRQAQVVPKLLRDNFFSRDPLKRVRYHLPPENMYNPSRNLKRSNVQLTSMKFFKDYPEYTEIAYIDRVYLVVESVQGNIKTLPLIQGAKSNGRGFRDKTDMPTSPIRIQRVNLHKTGLIDFLKSHDIMELEAAKFLKTLTDLPPRTNPNFSELRKLVRKIETDREAYLRYSS